MHLVEIETKLGKDGVVQIPDTELEATGLHEGDEVCLLNLPIPCRQVKQIIKTIIVANEDIIIQKRIIVTIKVKQRMKKQMKKKLRVHVLKMK